VIIKCIDSVTFHCRLRAAVNPLRQRFAELMPLQVAQCLMFLLIRCFHNRKQEFY